MTLNPKSNRERSFKWFSIKMSHSFKKITVSEALLHIYNTFHWYKISISYLLIINCCPFMPWWYTSKNITKFFFPQVTKGTHFVMSFSVVLLDIGSVSTQLMFSFIRETTKNTIRFVKRVLISVLKVMNNDTDVCLLL